MAQLTIQQTFELAIGHHGAGRLREAEMLYQQILSAFPRHVDSMHNMGVLAHQVGNRPAAVDLFSRTIALRSDHADAHNNLGVVLRELNKLAESIAACRRATQLRPDFAAAHFNLGLALNQNGQSAEAIAAYRQAIKYKPNYVEALTSLGIALADQDELDQAIASHRKAIALQPGYANAHHNLAVALTENKQYEEAFAHAKRAIDLHPGYPEAFNSLGNALQAHEQTEQAIAAYRQALTVRPDYPDAMLNLGIALQTDHQLDEAIAMFTAALKLQPTFFKAAMGLGHAHQEAGQMPQAIAALQLALALKPDSAEVMNNMGSCLSHHGQHEQAIEILKKAIAIKPDYADAYGNLATALIAIGKADEGMAACEKALEFAPNLPEVLSTYAGVLNDRGQHDQALELYRRALASDPENLHVHDSYCYAMNLNPHLEPLEIAAEHFSWNRIHTKGYEPNTVYTNDRSLTRPLRIGYVSADFRKHSVSHFFLPLFESHDRSRFEISCFSETITADETTEKYRAGSAVFQSTIGKSDAEVARMIQEARIDILVDLAGHTAGNRLRMFALKPAPVQASFLGYPATTGLDRIDYRLSDALADPVGMTDEFCSEKIFRLEGCAWCFRSPQPLPDVGELPAIQNGFVTFGSFNNLAKINEPLLKHWAEILKGVPGSKLMIKSKAMRAESVQQRIRKTFVDSGIDPARLDLRSWVAADQHFAIYNQIDIALDSIPYNGTTTTCDALSMGVPVIGFAGHSHVARVGVSLLTTVGLSECIGQTIEQYIQIATDLANDVPRLAAMRKSLRPMMQKSDLMNPLLYTQRIENAYTRMWQQWAGK